MQPILRLLDNDLAAQILDEAFLLLNKVGVKVQLEEARGLLADAGADVDTATEVVKISEGIIQRGLETAPREFWLYDRSGNLKVRYGGDAVHFVPGSSGVHYLDPETLDHRLCRTDDLVRHLKVSEYLPAYDAVSTSAVCDEVPKEIGDLYRLYLSLLFTSKPIVTGSFAVQTTQAMISMLALFCGGAKGLSEKPIAVFDVCPTPPLIWSEFGAQSLIDLARANVPAEMVSMPLAGAGSPVTILGSVVQHAAESLAGLTIHQLANPGAPIVWGGAPAIFDMREGTTPMGAIETAMMDAAYVQVGKMLGLPTHTYLGATDGKLVDYQAGIESGMTALIGGLAGTNMIAGAGMLDFLACISPEKLVLDAEVIGMVKRMIRGLEPLTDPLAVTMYEGLDFKADFLKHKTTRALFSKEQYLPSKLIDRKSYRAWIDQGRKSAWERAIEQTKKVLIDYKQPQIDEKASAELRYMVESLARKAVMEKLPELEQDI